MKLHPQNPTPGIESPVAAETIFIPVTLDRDTANLVCGFAEALADKLDHAQRKYGYSNGWKDPSWMAECRGKLREHLEKGDPRDVAAYCAFLWFHKEPTSKNLEACTEWTPSTPPKS